MSWRRIAVAWGGPLLIAGLVVFALRGFLFADRLTDEHPDLLAFWLPRWSFLGRSVAEGVIPLWNPFEMAGYRFAADPQSGWLYAPPMLLFSVLSPGTAIRAMVVLNPLLAGLGLYTFLRLDGCGRLAATVGGLSIAGAMSASEIAIAMPFAGAMAWSTVVLLGAAGFVRAERWWARVEWLALAGFAWSQVASAHMSHGLVVGTALLVAYLAAKTWGRGADAWGRAAVFMLVLPLLSLAVLLPRLEFIDASSLGEGYDGLGAGVPGIEEEPPIMPGGVWAGWPFAFSSAPGAYAGAAALLAVPLALRATRRRRTMIAFGAVLAATWVLLLPLVLGAGWVRSAVEALPYGDVLLHNPGRLRYVAVLALPALAALGVQGLREEPMPARRLAMWLGGGVVLWLGVPMLAGADPGHWALFVGGAAVATTAYLLATREPRWASAIAGGLVLELVIGIVVGGVWTGDEVRLGLEGDDGVLAFQPLREPDVDLGAFLAPTELVERIGNDRYLTWAPPAAAYEKGYLFAQDRADWPALANERGTLFGIRDALGYNPVQLPRYWAWVRAANPLPVAYNAAVLARPTASEVRTIGARYLVVPQGVTPTVPGQVVATAGGYDLVEVYQAPNPVEFRGAWDVVPSAGAAMRIATSDRFEERDTVLLEQRPGRRPKVEAQGRGRWRSTSPTYMRLQVRADRRGLVLIRTSYDENWHATIDGEPAHVMVADGFLQAVTVPKGRHHVVLRYEDPWVTRGLIGSGAVWLMLVIGWLAVLLIHRPVRS